MFRVRQGEGRAAPARSHGIRLAASEIPGAHPALITVALEKAHPRQYSGAGRTEINLDQTGRRFRGSGVEHESVKDGLKIIVDCWNFFILNFYYFHYNIPLKLIKKLF